MGVSPIRRRGSVSWAAAEGRRELLTALRDKIADALDSGVAARDLAALAKRLVDVSDQLELVDMAADGIAAAALTPDTKW